MSILTEGGEVVAAARADIESAIADLRSTIVNVGASTEDRKVLQAWLWDASDALDAAVDRYAALIL